jgi:hypothetical protein
MKKWLAALTCAIIFVSARGSSGEKPTSVAGAWDVTTRLPGNALAGRWTIQQKGATITGTARGARGDVPISGSIAGTSFRVTVADGDKTYKVRAMVDEDAMDGSVTSAGGEESAWHAVRTKDR